MNASLSPTSAAPLVAETASRAPRRGWIYSFTGVCFLFGAFLAAQLRAMEQMRTNTQLKAQSDAATAKQAQVAQKQYEAESQRSATLKRQLAGLQEALKKGDLNSKSQKEALTALNTRITELQAAAGLTTISGTGVVLNVDDSPNAKQMVDASGFGPGSVHDFDLQQIVNELRANKAEAISINGTRITGFTPIRCVGPSIQINWEPTAPPYTIEAVGNAKVLDAGLNLPGGILDSLKRNTLVIKSSRQDNIAIPATEGLPRLRSAQATGARLSDRRLDTAKD